MGDFATFLESRYEHQLSVEKLRRLYPRLYRDPVHRWRAERDVELVHREPTLRELERVWRNWRQMPEDKRRESDRKSRELFGASNERHHEVLVADWRSKVRKISFPEGEVEDVKRRIAAGEDVVTTRTQLDFGRYVEGDEVETSWGERLVVRKKRNFERLEDHPYRAEIEANATWRRAIEGRHYDVLWLRVK